LQTSGGVSIVWEGNAILRDWDANELSTKETPMTSTILSTVRAHVVNRAHLFAAALVLCGLALSASNVQADPLTFTIDSAQSYVTLTIPNFTFSGLAINLQGENRTNGAPLSTAWSASTNTGNTAFVSGTIATDLTGALGGPQNVTGVKFLAGSSAMLALTSGNYRPNPAAYNSLTSAYNNNSSLPQNYGSVANTALGNAALSSFSNTTYDITSPSALPVGSVSPANTFPVDGGYNPANTVSTGISASIFSVHGLVLFSVGQVIGNGTSGLGSIVSKEGPGTALGTFTFTSPTNLQMVVPVNTPFAINLGGGVFLNGTATGQYVANAAVPEPSTLILAGLACVSLVAMARRRHSLRKV